MRVNCGQHPGGVLFGEQLPMVILEGQEPEGKTLAAVGVVPCKPSRHGSLIWRRESAVGRHVVAAPVLTMAADMPLKARTEDLRALARAL
jgi:hypothetical protein